MRALLIASFWDRVILGLFVFPLLLGTPTALVLLGSGLLLVYVLQVVRLALPLLTALPAAVLL